MRYWSGILALWLFLRFDAVAMSSSPVHVIGEKLSAHDVISQIEDRLDIRITVDAEDHYGYRKDYDHWVTLDQFFLSLVKYFKTYNGVELIVEGGKRGRYLLKPLRPQSPSLEYQNRLEKVEIEEGRSSSSDSDDFLKPVLVDLDSSVSVSKQDFPPVTMKAKTAKLNSAIVEREPNPVVDLWSLDALAGENKYHEKVNSKPTALGNEQFLVKEEAVRPNLLAVEVIGFKMALPKLPDTPSLLEEVDEAPEEFEVKSFLGRPGIRPPHRPLLSHLRPVPVMGEDGPSGEDNDLDFLLTTAFEDREAIGGASELRSTSGRISNKRLIHGGLWAKAAVEFEKLDWDLQSGPTRVDRDRTWVKGLDFSIHYDLPLETPGLEVRASVSSRLPALWEDDAWMPHELQAGVHLGIKQAYDENSYVLLQLNLQSLPAHRRQVVSMDSMLPSLNLGWQWMQDSGYWAISAHLQKDPMKDVGFSEPLTWGLHWASLEPELPYAAALYFAAVEGGLEGQFSLSWNLKK